jgi:O-antigen ligase
MIRISLLSLCLLVAIVPWEENFVIPGVVSMSRVVGLVALGLGIVKVMSSGRLRPIPREMIWFALFIGWCMLALNWSISSEETGSRIITYVLLFAFVWLIWEVADTPQRQKALMRAFVAGTAVLVFNVYLRSVGLGLSLTNDEGRATAASANPNGVAIMCCMAIQYAFFLITRREKGKFELPNWLLWGFIVAAGIAIPMTGSRAGLACAVLMSLTFLPMLRQIMRRSDWKKAALLLLIATVIVVMVPLLASRGSLQRLTEGLGAHTFEERVEAWQRGLQAWRESPLLGVGPGTYPLVGEMAWGTHLASHNTYVTLLVEYGLVGSVLYFAFWLIILRRVLRMPGSDRFFWLVFLLAIQPMLITGIAEYYKWWWFIGAVIMCAAANPKPAKSAGRRFLGYPVRAPGTALRPPRPSDS